MNVIESKYLPRQLSRYRPSKANCYYDLNFSISMELDAIVNNLIDKRILDLGCGEQPFAEFFKDFDVETCDVQQNSMGTVQHIITPNSRLPFSENAFDVICLFDVLEHVKDDTFFIQELNRILTAGGLVISNTPFMYRFHEEPNDYRRYTPSGLRYLFEDVGGLEMKKIVPIGSPFFSASTLLVEKGFYVSLHRRILYRLFSYLLMKFRSSKEVGLKCPFSYFVLATKSI